MAAVTVARTDKPLMHSMGVDKSSILSRGLQNCWPFWRGANQFFDIVNNDHGTLTGPTWEFGVHGRRLAFDGVDDYTEIPNSPILQKPTVEMSLVVVGQIGDAASNWSSMVYKTLSKTSSPWLSYALTQNGSRENQLSFYTGDGISQFGNTGWITGIPFDTDLLIIGRHRGPGVAPNQTRLNIFNLKTGLELGTSPANATQNWDIGYSSESLFFGLDRIITGAKKEQKLEMVAVYDRGLSGIEMSLLRRDPFRVIRPPRRRRTYFVPSAPAIVHVVGESVNLSEQASHAKQIVQSFASTLDISDAVSRRGASVHSAASTVNLSDGQAFGLDLVRVVGETVNVSETEPWVRGLSHATGSTVNVSEGTLQPISSTLLHVVNDTVNMADAVNRRAAMVRSLASTVDITEATNTSLGLVRLSAAAINLAEQVNHRRAIIRLTAAGLNITEATLATRGILHLAASTVNLSDAHVHLVTAGGNALKQIVDDTLNLAEAIEHHNAIARLIGESVNITEGTLKAEAFVRAVADSVNVTESVDRLGSILRVVDGTLNVSDATGHLRAITKLFGSTLNLSDQTNAQRGIVRITGDTVTLAESIARAAALVRRIDTTVTVADAQIAARALRRLANEGIDISEAFVFSGVFPFVLVNESLNVSESIRHILTERGHVDLEDLMADLYRTSTLESDLDVESVMRDIFKGLKM